MHPILFEIRGFPVYTYGVLLAAAYLLGLQFALVRAKSRGLDPNRVMAFFFHGDDFDPGGRGEHSRAILAARGLPYVVVDQPALLTSHWAASTPQFAKLYGGCVLGFLDAQRVSDGAACRDDSFWAGTADALPLHPAASTSGEDTATLPALEPQSR